MSLFHTHNFSPTSDDMHIYCRCGANNSLHEHKWIKDREIFNNNNTKIVGLILKCEQCGELKNHLV